MNQTASTKNSEDEPVAQSHPPSLEVSKSSEKAESLRVEEEALVEERTPVDDPMDEDAMSPTTVFCIRLKQPRSNLQHKMSVPELCRNFRYPV